MPGRDPGDDSASTLGNRVARLVVEAFEDLPRNGKPTLSEWSVLAGIVSVPTDISKAPVVLSLATGTKCLGKSERRPGLVSDSHAEVLSRRLLNQFLLNEVRKTYTSEDRGVSSYFSLKSSGLCEWRGKAASLYLFISQLPCGDASICDKDHSSSDADGDVHRTGAKPVKNGLQDPKLEGKLFHNIGLLRTKPGRGEPTDCMSCSDKIARWIACGVQGSLLSILLVGPIPLRGIVIGSPSIYDEVSLRRALVDRHQMPLEAVEFIYADECKFPHSRHGDLQRCSTSVLFGRDLKKAEVAVDGRRHGIIRKHLGTPKAELSICRHRILLTFREALGEILRSGRCENSVEGLRALSYMQLKSRRPLWLCERRKRFEHKMPQWTTKEDRDFSQ
ncbi:tRNA-specific adenosine deaminase 1 [Galendromus occidentalis]|uniref:tRNA-specific adenosine deaminase 1 n=1 Tax=Galendromus occidentalis TaxID=34638 RepID=A0AAJ7L4M8_9ACAR|nr:tRNA-specific adenosine deaminase 1 [Galendromus occidentalis]